jgi:hypothetical protein
MLPLGISMMWHEGRAPGTIFLLLISSYSFKALPATQPASVNRIARPLCPQSEFDSNGKTKHHLRLISAAVFEPSVPRSSVVLFLSVCV